MRLKGLQSVKTKGRGERTERPVLKVPNQEAAGSIPARSTISEAGGRKLRTDLLLSPPHPRTLRRE
jgi:hypothetical protein